MYCNFCGISRVHIRKGTWVLPTLDIPVAWFSKSKTPKQVVSCWCFLSSCKTTDNQEVTKDLYIKDWLFLFRQEVILWCLFESFLVVIFCYCIFFSMFLPQIGMVTSKHQSCYPYSPRTESGLEKQSQWPIIQEVVYPLKSSLASIDSYPMVRR